MHLRVQLIYSLTAVFGLRHIVPAGLAQLQEAIDIGLEHQSSLA